MPFLSQKTVRSMTDAISSLVKTTKEQSEALILKSAESTLLHSELRFSESKNEELQAKIQELNEKHKLYKHQYMLEITRMKDDINSLSEFLNKRFSQE